MTRLLVLAYGNPGRGDDAIGPLLGERIEALGRPGVAVETPMQLNVEDAASAADHGAVLFIDASLEAPAPFAWRRVAPLAGPMGFTSHTLAPEAVLAVCRDIFGAQPPAWLMAVRGYAFEMGAALSPQASENLEAAWAHLHPWIDEQGGYRP